MDVQNFEKIEKGEGKMEDIDCFGTSREKLKEIPFVPEMQLGRLLAIRHFRDEFEWHVNNPELCQTQNYGIANYADPIPAVSNS
jgi:NADH-quinone oxidoreductase subunit F